MKILFIISFLLSWPVFLNSESLAQEKEKLETIYKKLQINFWKLKQDQLKKRQNLKDQIEFADNRIKTIYEKRNSLIEEQFLIEENISQFRETLNELQTQSKNLEGQIQQTIEKESLKLQATFPVMIQEFAPRLNQIKEVNQELDHDDLLKNIERLLDYKQDLIRASEEIVVYQDKIYHPSLSDTFKANILRVGFIQSLYLTEKEDSGILLRESDLSGIRYRWEENIPSSVKSLIETSVRDAVNLTALKQVDANQEISLKIPVDPIQSGKRLNSFLQNDAQSWFQSIAHFFIAGGFIMYPLLLLLLWALVLILEKIIQMKNYRIKKLSYFHQLTLNHGSNHSDLEQILSNSKDMVQSMLKKFIANLPAQRSEGEKILQDRLSFVIFKLEKRLSTLSTIATIAPLLGLLGTVTGMIQLFDVITLYGTSNPKILAGGISIALITTQTGLAIAIPIMVIHHFLIRLKNRFLSALDKELVKLLDTLY